jgi:hypothetical protein
MRKQRRGLRRDGTNPRALGKNPRALGMNERATARNKWALRNWKRKRGTERKHEEAAKAAQSKPPEAAE